jgi:hypothetical protein
MNVRVLRMRMKRLELRLAPPEPPPLRSVAERRQSAPEADRLPPHYWEVLGGLVDPQDLDPAAQEQLRRFREQAEAEHVRCLDSQPAGIVYRRELTRLGLPQPATLAGIDVIEECIRLAGIPSPAGRPGRASCPEKCTGGTRPLPNGFKELLPRDLASTVNHLGYKPFANGAGNSHE